MAAEFEATTLLIRIKNDEHSISKLYPLYFTRIHDTVLKLTGNVFTFGTVEIIQVLTTTY